jgi:hypothetical protein
MKLEINRSTKTGKVWDLGGSKVTYTYGCSVQLLASDAERNLWVKYDLNSKKMIKSGALT